MTTTTPLGATGVAPTTSVVNAAQSMGQNDFLKLLVAQLKYQDPMKPADSTQFMGEMAQFSTVQGVTTMGSTLAAMSHSTDVSQGIAMIGKTVSYQALDGTTASGVVGSVSSTDAAVLLHLASGNVDLKDVLEVSPGG
jgi:flagellar basal-body rod modification protein FlgD